jgi:uncharacterized protein (TIGR02271 family)
MFGGQDCFPVRFAVRRVGKGGAMLEEHRPDGKRGDGPPAEALLVALAAICAVVAATTADLDAPTAWTLVACVAAAYIVGRGAARGQWFAGASPAPAAAALGDATPAPAAAPAAGAGGRITRERSEGPEVTLHEEQIEVDRRRRPHERVQVHKHVVTEYVTLTVPVHREVLRIERVPIDAPHDPRAEADLTLMEDEPVVETRIVAKERVRLATDMVTEEREVHATVRREQADIERQPVPNDPPHTNPIDRGDTR